MARGLKSIENARELRATRKYGTPSPLFVVALAGSALAAVGVYAVKSDRDLESGKQQLLAERRAAMVTVGEQWLKLQTELQHLVIEAGKADSGEYASDFIAPELAGKTIGDRPTIYLRMRLAQAKNDTTFRDAMGESSRDGFTSCFFTQKTEVPAHSALAGVADAGDLLEQPWSLRQGIIATRVLDESWATDVTNAGDDMRLRAYQRDYEHAKKVEIPLAIDITKRSEYFVLLLDEDPAPGNEVRGVDGGAPTLADIETVPHAVRVHVISLDKSRKPMLRLRRMAEGQFRMAGAGSELPPETAAAMHRQVNNCALAGAVKSAIADKH